MDQKFINALNGKNESAGGLNLKEFRKELIKINPHQEALINSYGRKELEIYFRSDGKVPKFATGINSIIGSSSSGIGEMINTKKYVSGYYTKWKYAGEDLKRFVPDSPFLVEIKVASFPPPAKWEKISGTYYGADKMEEINKKISTAKASIDKPIEENEKVYSDITDILEYYMQLKYILKRHYHLEYCTNAWLKIVEMANYLPLISPGDADVVRHFANAELPGAFIKGIEYYMRCNYPDKRYDWLASSLVPTEEDKSNDAFGDHYKLWANNRRRWIMRYGAKPGDVDNGDTTKVENIHFMVEKTQNYWHAGADLYTSDAGISTGFGVHGDLAYNEQEQLNMAINLGQILVMLETIKVGGNFVTKQYTFFKPFTYSLMIIVASMFDKFYITKPLTSKPTNSETYLVGIGFKGLTADWKTYLEAALADYQSVVPLPGPLLPEDKLDKSAVDTIIEAADELYSTQAELVENNVKIFYAFKDKPDVLEGIVADNRKDLERKWIQSIRADNYRNITQMKS